MKKLGVLILLLGMFFTENFGQMIEKNYVLLEKCTGTWCGWCPSAARGAKECLYNGDKMAIVSYHEGDIAETSEGLSRIEEYYEWFSYPSAFIDGTYDVGGGEIPSTFPFYHQTYSNVITELTPFALEITDQSISGNELMVNIDVSQVAAFTGSDLRLHLVLTESNIELTNDELFEQLDFAVRDLVPDQYGTSFTINQGETLNFNLSTEINPDWVVENMEIVAFIQVNGTKEVLQTDKKLFVSPSAIDLSYFDNKFIIDPVLPKYNCGNDNSIAFPVQNIGSENITEFTLNYSVNGEDQSSITWNGNLSYYQVTEVNLPIVGDFIESGNSLEVDIVLPNGSNDSDLSNNRFIGNWDQPTSEAGTFILEWDVNGYGHFAFWEALNGAGEILASGGGYTSDIQFVRTFFFVEENECISLRLYNESQDIHYWFENTGDIVLKNTHDEIIWTPILSGFFSEYSYEDIDFEFQSGSYNLFETDGYIVSGIENPQSDLICTDEIFISPILEVRNIGTTDLVSFDLEWNINDTKIGVYSWVGQLAPLESIEIEISDLHYTFQQESHIAVNLTNPNGIEDQNQINNSWKKDLNIGSSIHNPGEFVFELYLDEYPEENSWELLDENGNVLYSGAGYDSMVNQLIQVPMELPEDNCFDFKFYDSYGDGLVSTGGVSGYFTLFNAEGSEVFNYTATEDMESEFSEYQVHFGTVDNSSIRENQIAQFKFYPNPAQGIVYIEFNDFEGDLVNISLYDIGGQEVFSQQVNTGSGQNIFNLSLNGVHSGVYMVTLQSKNMSAVEKLIKL